MRKIVVSLLIATLLSATASAPAFADGWRGRYHERGVADVLFWPIAAALTIPAAVIDTVAYATIPQPVVYGYAPPVSYASEPYYAPRVYYAPRAYYSPRGYYVTRGYYAPRGYYARGYYPARAYRTYRGGW